MRSTLALLHRWAGLFTALFLFVAGTTGAIISWDHELDAWLNPALFEARSGLPHGAAEGASAGSPMPTALELANRFEASHPDVKVRYLPLAAEPGHTLGMSVGGRIDAATGMPTDPGYNQVTLDPVSGEAQGRREWGAISLSRENLLPFLYKLHYSLHIPDIGMARVGVWFFGAVAIVWLFDCFIALWISFPSSKSWRKSFAFRWRQGGNKLNFDLHRSGGVWLWLLLLVLAVTSVSMNLSREIVRPLVSVFSDLTPSAFDSRVPTGPNHPVEPVLNREQAVILAQAEALRRGWKLPAGGVFYAEQFGLYGVGFFEAGNDHGDGGLGTPWLYFDGITGAPAGDKVPGAGSAGDIFLQAQFPLHSGRIVGLPGRILVSIMGAMVAMLSVTGLIIWVRKRRARAAALERRAAGLMPSGAHEGGHLRRQTQ